VSALRRTTAIVWLVLSGPLVVQTIRYVTGATFYGEYLQWTGVVATQLLLLTLAVTPLRRLLPRTRWILSISRWRRDIGVATSCYALAHTLSFLIYKRDVGVIVEQSLEAELLTGWIAMLLFAALAATSNDASVRRLGRRWKRLHRSVYLAAALTMAHWILTAFDPTTGLIYLAIFVALLLLRLLLRGRKPGDADPAGN
jgi:sulfoxide reductase heme-binding subunit YedZ